MSYHFQRDKNEVLLLLYNVIVSYLRLFTEHLNETLIYKPKVFGNFLY